MLSAGDISFSYDIGGNMVEKDNNGDTVAYEWDEENNLAKVTLSDGTSMELTYDGDDIRASRTIDGEEVHFAWDPQSFNVVGEYDDLGNEDVAYGPQIGMDDPWVMERENNAYFYQTDHLNSVTELTDENEAVQNEYRYKAFGEALSAVEMVENEFQFTARRRDGVDGIQFNRFRHYQAEFGRWNQWDRIRYGDGPNMYGYVFNSPLNYSDRRGLFLGGVGKAVAKGVRRTWKLVKKGMHYGKGAALAPKDFIKNYMAMRSKNFIGADKFYHCVTHCEAAKRGAGGSDMAYMLGEIREYFDLYIKGDSISAVDADRDANRHGLNVCEDVACDEHCAKYMPEGFKP